MLDVIDKNTSWTRRQQAEYQQGKSELNNIADTYIELFVDFCILEERKENRLPAFEGIRLVRESVSS
jgi:hypothetical protein